MDLNKGGEKQRQELHQIQLLTDGPMNAHEHTQNTLDNSQIINSCHDYYRNSNLPFIQR